MNLEILDKEFFNETCDVTTCRCGNTVELWNSWANECENCGQEYNGFGQALRPREEWGYETGEEF